MFILENPDQHSEYSKIILDMIERTAYKEQSYRALKRSRITALLGPRQFGKTTLAREIAQQVESHFLDLESPTDMDKMQNPELYLSNLHGLIIIDEIQIEYWLTKQLRMEDF